MSLKVRSLSKSVDQLLVLNDIDLTFKKGLIYGLIGQNDSGKSTLLRILANLRFPSEGYVQVDKGNLEETPELVKNIYFQSHDEIYGKRTKIKHITKWMSQFYPSFQLAVCQELLAKYDLNEPRRFQSLSINERVLFRNCLSCSVDVPYLLLDEPSFGIDAYHRHLFYQDLQDSMNRSPKAIILSTHVIDEVEEMLDEVVLLEDGQVIVADNVDRLVAKSYSVEGTERDVREFLQQKEILGQEYRQGNIKAYVQVTPEELYGFEHLTFKHLNLQELFIQLTHRVETEREGQK